MDTILKEVQSIKNTSASAVEAYVKFYTLEKEIAKLKKEFLNEALQECDSTSTTETQVGDYLVKLVNTTTYEYNDSKLKNLEELIKNRKNLMKKACDADYSLLDEYGHVISPAIKKESKTIRLSKR